MSRSLVIKNAVAQYGFVAARYVIPLLSLPFLARVLGPDSYGVRAYILSFMLLVQAFADFGFNMSGAKEVVETKSEQGKRNRLVTAITLSKLCFLLALLVVSMVAASVLDITRDHLACVLIAYIGIFFLSFLSMLMLVKDLLFVFTWKPIFLLSIKVFFFHVF